MVQDTSSMGELNIGNQHQELPIQKRARSSLRPIACETCRTRKVRCDRLLPTCSRCAKLGKACQYSDASKPGPSKIELSQQLKALNQRLEQAESQLAFRSDVEDIHQLDPLREKINKRRHVIQNLPSPGTYAGYVIDQQNMNDWSIQLENNVVDYRFEDLTTMSISDMQQQHFEMNEDQTFSFNPAFLQDLYPPLYKFIPSSSISLSHALYNRYFDVFHPVMPIVNRTRFQTEILQTSPLIEVQLLSHTIEMLGALSTPALQGRIEGHYEQARNLIETLEREETGGSLVNINTLQAYVMLTLYEFSRPNFARSYMTLGRAIRLVKIMSLDKVARQNVFSLWGLHTQLALSLNAADEEERRRTFWTVYIFDAFASVRTSFGSAFDKSISVPLPSYVDYPDFHTKSDTMPSLQNVFELSESISISPQASVMIMLSLYRQCFEHIQSADAEPSYAFWETHFRISHAIDYCRNNLLLEHLSGDSTGHPLTITMRANINSIEITLYEAALVKAEKDDYVTDLIIEAKSRCTVAARDIAYAIQLGRSLKGTRLEGFRQLGQFLIWPMSTAIRAFLRVVSDGDMNASLDVGCIQSLCSSIRDLVSPEHIPSGLLEKADAVLALHDTGDNCY